MTRMWKSHRAMERLISIMAWRDEGRVWSDVGGGAEVRVGVGVEIVAVAEAWAWASLIWRGILDGPASDDLWDGMVVVVGVGAIPELEARQPW